LTEENVSNPSTSRWIPWMTLMPFLAIFAVWQWGFRPVQHVDQIAGKIAVEAEIHTVRILGETGNLQVVIGTAGTIEFVGRALSVVQSAEHVQALKAAPVTLMRVSENAPPGTMVLRVSAVPKGFRRILTKGTQSDSQTDLRPGVFRQVDLDVAVPVDLKLEVVAEESNLRVDTRQASTSLDIEKGNVLVMHTSDALRVRNGGGPTVIEQHRGSLDAKVGGQLRVTLAELTASIDMASETGRIGLYLPIHSSFKVDAKSNINVRNAFGLEAKQTGPTEFCLSGDVGDGEHHEIAIRAKSGPVTLAVAAQQ